MGRSAGLIGFLILVAVLIVGGFLAVDRLAGEEAAETVIDKPELGTATIVQTDLIELETFPAVLRFADPQIITTATGGTVTRLPAAGVLLDPGDSIWEMDGAPVVLFIGERPMWRPLALPLDGSDLEGPDVLQLEENLAELGYPTLRDDDEELPDVGAPDELFDDDTVRLIEDWRADIGLSADGFVEMGRVVYLDGGVRVARTLASTGSFIGPGAPVLEVSSADQEVFLQLPVDRRDLIELGASVRVTLPDDVIAAATIIDIGSVVTYLDPDAPGVISVSIRLDDPSLGAAFDESPVDVEIVANEVIDALAVPVNALLALAEGGYALEVDRGGVVSLILVETGIYVDGLVEVTGEVVAGDTIIVPR